jgi:hypothetical protein
MQMEFGIKSETLIYIIKSSNFPHLTLLPQE